MEIPAVIDQHVQFTDLSQHFFCDLRQGSVLRQVEGLHDHRGGAGLAGRRCYPVEVFLVAGRQNRLCPAFGERQRQRLADTPKKRP